SWLARRSVSGGGRQMPRDQRAHRIGRLRTLLEPEVDALFVDLHDRRLGARVVVAEDFDERAVARRARIGDHDAEERTLLGPGATKTNDDHTCTPEWLACSHALA